MNDTFFPVKCDEGSLISPYVVAFTPLRQTQIILGKDKVIANESNFIKSLSLDKGEEISSFPYARVYLYDSDYLNIYITLPTNVKERDSGRYGLDLTLGALIHRSVFDRFTPCFYFMRYFCMKFGRVFNVNLYKDGASIFTENLNEDENRNEMIYKMIEMKEDLQASLFQIPKVEPPKKWFMNSIFRNNKTVDFPNFILCMNKSNGLEHLLSFFAIVDANILDSRKITTDVFATIEEKQSSLTIIPCLPQELSSLIQRQARGAIVSNGQSIPLNYLLVK